MNYQKIVCCGDSQTYGARTYGCYPLYLVRILNGTTRYTWNAVTICQNGYTARDLWFRLGRELLVMSDAKQACILVGANDVGNATPVELFAEYYRQILDALAIAKFRVVHCGEIPRILTDGHPYFTKESEARRADYNAVLEEAVSRVPLARLVRFPSLSEAELVDPVHFSEQGNLAIAQAFAASIAAI